MPSTSMIDRQFRYYSRRVIQYPNELYYHEQRLKIAQDSSAVEPLQGALADLCFGCWYELPYMDKEILSNVESRLHPRIFQAFSPYIYKQAYMEQINPLATRWSVLVTPSLNVASHNLRTSRDDSRFLADNITKQLLLHREQNNQIQVALIEADFFAHCLACNDLVAFTIVWFKLGKQYWEFDERWERCQENLKKQVKYN